jgi:hypothetical protein
MEKVFLDMISIFFRNIPNNGPRVIGILGLILASGCAIESKPLGSIPAITLSMIVEPMTIIPIQKATQTATTLIISTKTSTPSKTSLPQPEYIRGIAGSLDKFTLVTQKQEQEILTDIMNHPEMINPTSKAYEIQPQLFPTYSMVALVCNYCETCIVRASIREIDPSGSLDIWKFICELRDPDGSNKYIVTYIGGGLKRNIEYPAQLNRSVAANIMKGQRVSIQITTKYDLAVAPSEPNPYSVSITNEAPNQEILRKLERSKTILPEGIQEVTV